MSDEARRLLVEVFARDPGGTFIRTLEIAGLGGDARGWAEAWAELERLGVICREPNTDKADLFFLTRAGRDLL